MTTPINTMMEFAIEALGATFSDLIEQGDASSTTTLFKDGLPLAVITARYEDPDHKMAVWYQTARLARATTADACVLINDVVCTTQGYAKGFGPLLDPGFTEALWLSVIGEAGAAHHRWAMVPYGRSDDGIPYRRANVPLTVEDYADIENSPMLDIRKVIAKPACKPNLFVMRAATQELYSLRCRPTGTDALRDLIAL